jgi:hypothetical protein
MLYSKTEDPFRVYNAKQEQDLPHRLNGQYSLSSFEIQIFVFYLILQIKGDRFSGWKTAKAKYQMKM